jgi:hypothetical protein
MAAVIQEIFLVGYHSPFGFNFLATNSLEKFIVLREVESQGQRQRNILD